MPSGTTSRVIYLTKTSGTTDCTGPSNNVVPGGFGWLTVNNGVNMTIDAAQYVYNWAPLGTEVSVYY